MKRFDVVIAGEANLDLILYGLPETLPPERELLASGMELSLGGSSAITAHNLAALGSRVGFISAAASDPFSELCRRELSTAGVDLTATVAAGRGAKTGVSVLLPHPHGRRTLTYDGTTALLRYEHLDLAYVTDARHFHLSSYFLQAGLRAAVPTLLAHCKEAGLTVSFDPNDDPSGEWPVDTLELLRFVDVLMPNESEACRLMHEPDVEQALAQLRRMVPMLVVKRGARGAVVFQGEHRLEAPAHAVEPVDAVGAGDSFNAGFLHAFLHGADARECLRMGNLAGAFSTTAAGGTRAFCDREALRAFLDGSRVGPLLAGS